MKIQDIMTAGAEVITPQTTLRQAAQKMSDDNIGALPVGENDRLIGMVTDRDIAVRGVTANKDVNGTTVREVMSEGIYYCFEDDDVDVAANLMADRQVHRLPVLNRDKRLVGVIALADLATSGTDAVKTAVQGISQPGGRPRH